MHNYIQNTLKFLLLVIFAGTSAVYADVIAIKAGHIVHPDTGKIQADKIIIVDGTKIKSIVDSMPDEGIDRVIDLSDKWLLPGLMDLHTHITFNMSLGIPRDRADYAIEPITKTAGYRALIGLQNATDMLEAGFTTIRDVGNNGNYADSDLAKAFRNDLFVGPRIINSGKIISVYGAQSHGISHEVGDPWKYEYIEADSADEIIKAIRKNVFYGAKLIKIVVGDQKYEYSLDDMKLIVREARKMGMTVAAHAYGDQQVRNASLAGVNTIDHGDSGVTEEVFKIMAREGTILVGTDFPIEHLLAMRGGDAKAAKAAIDRYNKRQTTKIQLANKAGVTMAFGTDAFSNMNGKNRAQMTLDYLDVYVRVGLKPMDILKMMTINGALALNMDKDIGKLTKGYVADIIAVSGDPTKDVMVLKDVNFVMRAGSEIRNN